LGEIRLGEMGLGEMGLGEMGQNPIIRLQGRTRHLKINIRLFRQIQLLKIIRQKLAIIYYRSKTGRFSTVCKIQCEKGRGLDFTR